MTTHETVLNKVRKLLRLADKNSNPHEAAAAAAKAQALIDEYQLQAALLSLEATEAEPDEPIEDFQTKGAPLHRDTYVARWRAALASTLARHNACKIYASGGNLELIGRASDAETVRYLFAYCAQQIETLTNQHGRGCGATWRNNFRLGCVDTIARKLQEQKAAATAEARAKALTEGGSQALVRVDQALAKVEQRRAAVEAWTKANVKLVAGSGSRSTYDPSARHAGRRAGESIHVGSRAWAALR